MSERLTKKEIQILELMKEKGFEKELIVGIILCCGKFQCEDEIFDLLHNKSDCDDQDLLNAVVEISLDSPDS